MEEELKNQTEEGVLQIDLKKERKHFSRLGLMYFLGTLLVLGAQIGISKLAVVLYPDLAQNGSASFLVAMLPVYAVGMPLMALLIRTVPGKKVEPHKMSVGKWILAFAMCYAILYVGNSIGNIITAIIGAVKGGAVTNIMAETASSISPWASILTMVLITPVLEELLFRKLLVERLIKYGEGVAVVLSALIFGLFHGNLNQFAYAFGLGLFLAFLYTKTGKLHYTILIHMGINFLGSVVSIWALNASGFDKLMTEGIPADMSAMVPGLLIFVGYMIFVLAMVILGLVFLILKRKKFALCPGEVTIPKGKRFSTTIINVGMLLFCIFWIVSIVWQLFV